MMQTFPVLKEIGDLVIQIASKLEQTSVPFSVIKKGD
jgi:hypothetical protein